LVIGGSRGMVGAPAMVSNAALRSGAGLVTVACPRSIQLTVAGLCPCATSIALPENDDGCVSPGESQQYLRKLGLLDAAGAPSVVAAGPGLGHGDRRYSEAMVGLLLAFAETARTPVVLDADALNALATSGAVGETRPASDSGTGSLILTPHPGEMARLHGVSTPTVQADREGYAVRTARMMTPEGRPREGQTVVVLKGAGTVVTDGERCCVNRTGNPGMATGGSGDVLTGVIAGLVGQGMSTFDAAVLGVHVHGLAGDLAAKGLGQISLIATDLIDFLPKAWQATRRRR
jgi:NAD(P)H-hydrate epimerase